MIHLRNTFSSILHAGLNQSWAAFFIAITSFTMGSCVTTHYRQLGSCATSIRPGSKCLVLWLPDRDTDLYLQTLTSIFEKKNVAIKYLAAEEWNLKASGILNPLDSANFSALKKLGYTHFLVMRELSCHAESSVAYYTDVERSWEQNFHGYKPTLDERGNESEVLLQLISLEDEKATHALITKTNIGHVAFRNKHDGETFVNVTAHASARFKAAKKGAKRMVKQCTSDVYSTGK